ncbi:MFS transporter [Sporolactobacillus nakayamae]|uniref:Predicted arabinose efflux permease, MFS family n=1 Tax=Sporolactobacillus nakayamae TaxID=269670 RepID=A0A1I2QEE1_9BACL|nr:MFS transporter [Sporolactobacillus nakayamae]SFG24116.1 Predicted arabinose efflux permease, MFS family [Sporolactobacillus nakayamae]
METEQESFLARASRLQIKKAVTSDFIGNFSSSLFNFAISLYILKLTGSAMNFGTTLLIVPLIGIVFSPLIGYLADHYDHKRVMITTQIGCIVLLIIYSSLFPILGSWHYLMVLIMVATLGLNARIFSVTYLSAVSRLVDKPFIQQLNSLEQSANALAMIVGPIAAGVVFAFVPFQAFIYFEIVAEIAVVLIVLTMNFHLIEVAEQANAKSESMWSSMKQGLIYVKKQPLILSMILVASVLNFLCGVFNVGFPYLMIHVLHMQNIQYSLSEALFSLGMVAGGLFAAKLTVDSNPIGMVSKSLMFEGLPLIFVIIPLLVQLNSWVSTTIFGMVNFVLALVLVFVNVPLTTYMQKTIPTNYQGRVFTILMVGSTSLQPLGMFIYGVLFQYVSAIAVIVGSFIGILGIGIFAWTVGGKAAIQEEKFEG